MNRYPEILRPADHYKKDGDVWIAWPEQMSELAQEEAGYHDKFDEDAVEVHQLDAWRNVYYHKKINDLLQQINKNGRILEVGAGSGSDAESLKGQYELVLSDVSPKTLQRLRDKKQWNDLTYVALDGQHLPFKDQIFDGVYMVATWHHLESPVQGLKEVERVLKRGGRIVFGVEPSKTYFLPLKIIRPILIFLTRMRGAEVSHADEEMIGFTYGEIKTMFDDGEWNNIQIKPMWFLAGWMHYMFEFLFRALKLKKRIRIPQVLEKLVVLTDEILFKIPGVKHLAWHWIITARKA